MVVRRACRVGTSDRRHRDIRSGPDLHERNGSGDYKPQADQEGRLDQPPDQ